MYFTNVASYDDIASAKIDGKENTLITTADAERVAGYMAMGADHLEMQTTQTYFSHEAGRSLEKYLKVRASWKLAAARGDMTAVLADAVGSTGHVTAVDIAPREYGAPLTVGQSTDHLKATELGERIDFHFECDLMSEAASFAADSFDCVVLAHCSWYFESLSQLRDLLAQVRPWSRRLCFAEWSLEPQSLDQVPHLLAILIQGQVEAYKTGSQSNVRTPFSQTTFNRILGEAGWNLTMESIVDSTPLQDARWEINGCLSASLAEAEALQLPAKHQELLGSQTDTLREMAASRPPRSLMSYAIVAGK